MRKLWVLVVGVAALVASSVAFGDQPPSQDPVPRSGDILGIVPVHSQAGGHTGGAGGNLSYHNGPVMHTNQAYAIYWVPSGYSVPSGYTPSSSYESLINQFFTDVSAASGKTSNVYWSDTQYYDNTGKISGTSTTPASIVDTNPFPNSGCTDSATAVCLTDAQIQTEINKVIPTTVSRAGTIFFMFTPPNVGSCYSGSQCAFTYYCAYHSHFGSGSNLTLYANMPYAAWVPAACGSGQSPNGNDADSTINVTSHEHNETITDQLGNAWYDRRGYEDGDKCAWNFGSPIGGTASNNNEYNQQINGHDYYLQQEWSNHSSGCVLTGL